MRPSETRLPDVPNQQRFLELWYTWYRSYEEGGHNNGTEERRALIGERLEDISPGHLPRSLHELERGSPVEPNEVNIPFSAPADTGIEEAGQDDNGSEGPLFDPPTPELANEPFHGSFGPRPGQRTNLTYRTFEDRRPSGLEIAALREDLTHIKRATERVIMGIRSLDENEEDAWNTTNNGNALNDCLEDLTRRIDRHSDIEQAAMATTTEQPPHSSPVSDPRLAGPAFTWDACVSMTYGLVLKCNVLIFKQRERTYFVENLIPHVFLVSGSPEDCLYFADNELSRAQEENDIALRYYNAVNTRLRLTRTQRNRFFQEAEQNRLRQQSHQSSNQQPQADGSLGRHTQPANSQGLSREQEGADQALAAASNGYSLIPLWGNQGNRLPGPSQQGQVDDTEGIALSNLVERAESLLSSIESENGPQHQLRAMYARIRERHVESEALLPHGKGLDRADGRPQAMDDTDMLVRMECKICFSQVATIAVLPCGTPFFSLQDAPTKKNCGADVAVIQVIA